MGKLLDWLIEKFSNPLSPFFFVIGACLIVLGVSNGFTVWGVNLAALDNYRYITIGLGILALAISLLVLYRPPETTPELQCKTPYEIEREKQYAAMPAEMTMPWVQKLDYLTSYQKKILKYIEVHGSVNFRELSGQFSDTPNREMYYRLEQLHLLGFIAYQRPDSEKTSFPAMTFTLSKGYVAELGEHSYSDRTIFN